MKNLEAIQEIIKIIDQLTSMTADLETGDFAENFLSGKYNDVLENNKELLQYLGDREALEAAIAELIQQQVDGLYEQNAVSKQQYDLSIAQRDSAQAQVTAQEAILENAQINMGDTEVKAPFSGRISTSDLSVGNFVAAGQTVLATMSNTNPVRIKFSMSENEYLQLSKAHSDSGAKALEDLKLVLSDGSVYTGAGVVDQVDREIGSGTGALTLKAKFSNDNNVLMPGMFARLQANAGTMKNALLIPQRAVREMLYKKFVFVVGSDNKVDMKEVTLGARVGKLWLVEKGLNGDETLVVEGVQKVNKGSEVKPAAMTEADLSNESKQ